MDNLTITQRIKIIKTYYRNGDSATNEINEIGVVTNIERPMHHRFDRSAKNIAIVSQSIPHRSHELGLL